MAMRTIWGALAAALAAAVGLAPAAHGAAVAPPGPAPGAVALERGAQFSSVGTALAANGRGIVVWASRAPRYEITAVAVAADGSLGAPVVLSTPGTRASAPLVGMSADGEAIVAWQRGARSRGVSLCVLPRAVAESLAGPASDGPCVVNRISTPLRRAILQSLVVGDDGSAIVAWLQQTARGWRAAVAERTPGRPFGRMRLVGPPGATAADVALGPTSATLVFSRTPARAAGRRRGSEIRLASWLRGEAPASTTVASPRGHVAVRPRVAVDDRDDAVVAWESMYGDNEFAIAYARIRDCTRTGCANGPGALARLGPLHRLGPGLARYGAQAGTSDLTVSATADRLVIGWVHLPADQHAGSQIRLAQWADGELGAPVRVSAHPYIAYNPQVVARGERTIVVFREYDRPGVRDGLVVARVADAGSLDFAPPAGLSSPALIQQFIARPRLALAPSGAALVVFTNYGADRSGAGEVSLARLAGS